VKIGWVVGEEDHNSSCFLARVFRPHQQLLAWGMDSRLLGPAHSIAALRECNVLIFHRTTARLKEVAGSGITLGFDLADDLLAHQYAKLPVDFILTDSLPNTRFYLTRHTHYWPHGFPDQTTNTASADTATRFVYCGAPENVHCLLGAPLDALETIGATKPLVLRIITNLGHNKEAWLAKLPAIEPRNYRIEWLQFEQATHEQLMKQCDVGIFPQAIDKERWRKKSIYKPTHAASLGLPSISSPTEEASMNFLHGQTIMLPHSAQDWIDAVRTMADEAERGSIRRNVIALYQTRFTIEMATQQVLAIARYQCARKPQLRFKGLRSLLLRSFLFGERILDAVQKRI
jgi:hypothetical protein